MKRIFSLLLSVLLICSTLPLLASAEGELTNVALNRPCFSYYQSATTYADPYGNVHHADRATDGDMSTQFYTGYGNWFYVDLGAQYPIEEIKLYMGQNISSSDTMKVHLSNTSLSSGITMYQSVLPSDLITVFDSTTAEVEEGAEYIINANTWYTIDVSANENKTAQYVYIVKSGALAITELEVNTAQEVAENAPYWVEIGAFKPVMATTYQISKGTQVANYLPWFINDRNINTAYQSTDITYTKSETSADANYRSENLKQKVVIDLEASYPINAIILRPMNNTYSKNYKLYVTNDPNSYTDASNLFATGHSHSNAAQEYYGAPTAMAESSYRYVVIESVEALSGTTYSQKLGIADILIYTDATQTLREPVRKYNEADNRAHLTSLFMQTNSNYSSTSNYANVSDGNILTSWYHTGSNGQDANVVIDLGEAQKIDYITATRGKTADNLNKNIKIFVTNDKTVLTGASEYENYKDKVTVIYDDTAGTGMATAHMQVYPVNLTEKYRYVGAWIPQNDTSAGYSRKNIASLDVYTKTENLDEIHTTLTLAQDATTKTTFTAKADKFLSATGRDYNLIAVCYDANKKLVGVQIEPISKLQGFEGPLSESVSIADMEKISEVKTVKLLLWDSMSVVRPVVAASEEFSIE